MITILIFLNICHWLADYSPLSTPKMLAAKRTGKPLFPILNHAAMHGALMGLFLAIYLPGNIRLPLLVFGSLAFETVTHFVIDVLKGRLNVWYPPTASPANKIHWLAFGLDQLLHQVVIILIAGWVVN